MPLLRAFVFFAACAASIVAAAEPVTVEVWPGKPPGETKELPAEADQTKSEDNLVAGRRLIRLGNVSTPQLAIYRPAKEKDTGAAVIICPGGGHHILAYDLEGTEVAEWLNSIGVTGIVLKYRVPFRDPEKCWRSGVQDAQRSVSLVRSRASEWNIDPHRIGLLGFSAGGEIAGLVSMLGDDRQYEPADAIDKVSSRPDFAVLIYPGGFVDRDTLRLHEHIKVTKETPPMFFAHAADDGVSALNSLLVAAELKRAGVAADVHVFAKGGHGYGLRHVDGVPVTDWPKACEAWMRSMGYSFAAGAQASPFAQRENVVYAEANGIGLVMDIFTPTGPKNGLGIVDVISGAWHSDRGKIRDHMRAQTFQILCRKGYTVFAIRPGSITKFSAPEMLANLNQGIRWVKAHSQEYGIDPERLGLMGASAGGHLACLAAVTADEAKSSDGKATSGGPAGAVSTRVKASAVFFPPTDFLNYGGKAIDARADDRMGEIVRRLAFPQGITNETQEDLNQKLTQISPARLVTPRAPPFLLIHGDADPVVPLQQSEAMLAALKDAGVPAELIVKKGGGHPWLTLHEEVEVLAAWFDKQLGKE